jgi:crotonobetainyl-CoA:carnitine CoA-transferase CaiB-like acyl-CoA transferase
VQGEGNSTEVIDSPRWLAVNYNKRGLSLDLKRPEAKAVLRQLVAQADIVMQNFRPQIAAKLGLDYASIREMHPSIIYSSQSGVGDTGPSAHRQRGDTYAQAMSGVVSIQGGPGEPPYLGGVAWVDHGGAAVAALAIVLALYEWQRSGRGQSVSTNLLDIALFCQAGSSLSEYLMGGPMLYKGGRGYSGGFPYGTYPASDGDVVVLLGGADRDWPRFCQALGLDDLGTDPRYDTDAKRRAAVHELFPILDAAFRRRTRAEWAQEFRKYDLRADPCLTHEEMLREPQVEHNGIITEAPHPTLGVFPTIGIPIRLSETPGSIRTHPPGIGEHSTEVLAEYGFTPDEIQRLVEDQVVYEPQGAPV